MNAPAPLAALPTSYKEIQAQVNALQTSLTGVRFEFARFDASDRYIMAETQEVVQNFSKTFKGNPFFCAPIVSQTYLNTFLPREEMFAAQESQPTTNSTEPGNVADTTTTATPVHDQMRYAYGLKPIDAPLNLKDFREAKPTS
eukprot:c2699_g1_i1.p1 GENE.c2699_g1_i1~~c2699_g1_i1.p1  ORF type:complete len:143 (+),score=28.39 c2699_g1_i1:47-475(+)